ncbi:site-specific DNA-methyltransferase [Candidatus Falkowbacteria bacterium]|nr:site-specific DNA-methyltransferase [Candidatus Falkowbacteria bacterium]
MPTKKPKNLIKYGDCFKLGEHHLCCGDCRDIEFMNKFFKGHKIKLILCDVPYGVSLNKSEFLKTKTKHRIIAGDEEQSEAKYRQFNKDWLIAIKPYLEKKNAFYIFNSDKMIFALRQGIEDAGFHFGQLLIWIKSQAVVGRLDYLPQHELIAYGWYGTHEFFKSKDKSLLFCPKPQANKLHPTMKPISLLRNLILNSTRIGDYVYDGFLGSGSTLLACEQTKRKSLSVEIDPDYCQTIIDRFEAFTNIKAKKLN